MIVLQKTTPSKSKTAKVRVRVLNSPPPISVLCDIVRKVTRIKVKVNVRGRVRVLTRLGICRDRRDRRSCKIFVSCVNFSRKQRSFIHILQPDTHLNVNILRNC